MLILIANPYYLNPIFFPNHHIKLFLISESKPAQKIFSLYLIDLSIHHFAMIENFLISVLTVLNLFLPIYSALIMNSNMLIYNNLYHYS